MRCIEKFNYPKFESVESGEYIVTAALYVNGKVYSYPRPNRHDDVMWREDFFKRFKQLSRESRAINAGFVTSTRRFVDRQEAAKIFKSNHPDYDSDYLISEDLWSGFTPENSEFIVGTAIKLDDQVYATKRPHRHGDNGKFVDKLVELRNQDKKPIVIEGFWTSLNRFVGRRESMKIFKNNHPQVVGLSDDLYSEDLWSDLKNSL